MATVLGPIGALADHAIIYAGLGREIFPVNPADKTPLVSQYKATTDTAQVAAWWQRWPNALIGHRIPEHEVVLDVDPKSGGNGTWAQLKMAAGMGTTTTRRHLSGRNDGGGHTWWLMPGDKVSISRLDAWAEERGLGHAILDRDGHQLRWTCGIDILHHRHRYTILPPSPHPDTGMPYRWKDSNFDTPAEPLPQYIVDLIVDDAPPPEPKPRQQTDPDSIADWYSENHTWASVLEGWTLIAGDGDSDGARWKHPTATSKFSATVRHGCLFVYSPNTPFEPTVPGTPHGYTRFAAYALLNHQDDYKEAARTAREMKDGTRRPVDDGDWSFAGLGSDDGAAVSTRDTGTAPEPPPAKPTHLPDEFWTARPELEHIRTAARSRLCAPDALFAATLCRVVQHIDYRLVLPPIIGGIGTLNMFAAIVAPSGAGKGAASSSSAELLRLTPITGYRTGEAPAGSGEGLVHAFYERVTEMDGKKKVTVMQRRYEGLLIRCDEGQALTALAGRTGQTTMETLRQAFSGETLGGSYSTGDKRVTLDAHQYRLSMLMAVQPIHARGLLDDWAGGTPQRFWWTSATDPDAPSLDDLPDHPGPLQWNPPPWDAGQLTSYQGYNRGELGVDPVIVREIREHHRAVTTGNETVGRYDGHRNYVRLKIAGALAVLDGRLGVNLEDWALSGMVMDTSDGVRNNILNTIRDETEATELGRDAAAARRAAAEQGARRRVDDTVLRVAKVIARRVHKLCEEKESLARRDVTQAVKNRDREWADLAIAHAEAMGWVVLEEGRFSRGDSKPV